MGWDGNDFIHMIMRSYLLLYIHTSMEMGVIVRLLLIVDTEWLGLFVDYCCMQARSIPVMLSGVV